jgi:hypothetical protein
MALSTYSELQTALAAWLDGSDFAGRETDFIALCEDEISARLSDAINRGASIRRMLTRSALTIDAEYVAQPDTDMILPLTIEVSALDRPWQISYIDPDSLVRMKYDVDNERDAIDSLIGSEPPRYYTIVGDQFRFFPAPQSSFTSEFIRYVRPPALSDASPTNWILTNHRNVYLYGALAQAEMFGWNDARMANLATLFVQAIDGLIARYPVPSNHAPLRSEVGQLGRTNYSYNSFMSGI